MDAETFALIVGGGPVGLAAAIELYWRAVPAVLVTDKLDTAQHPKCNNTNARSMEHFRRLGIADELRSEGLPPHVERASAYVTRFCGHEFGRLPRRIPIGRRRKSPTTSRRWCSSAHCGAAPSGQAAHKSISAGGSIHLPSKTITSLPTSRMCKPVSASASRRDIFSASTAPAARFAVRSASP